ncbi:MAG: ATP-binding protein [Candidatus ainarchaeum sp.]|nr:ATP-binding protein [Candidatus ainarchaeum sp.]
MNLQLGTVVSTIDGPSPSKFDFVVNNGSVHKGMFVELNYSEGTMICLVEELIKTNRYFERPDSVKTIGAELEKNFPTADWEFLIAKAKPLGVFYESLIKRATLPPSPGTKVFIASNENIKKFLKLEDNGLNLGSIQFHDIPLKLNLSKLLQKHLSVLAMSGAGKSFLMSVILEELQKRSDDQGKIATIVFDTHGEYTSFGEPVTNSNFVDFSANTRVVDGSKIKISVSNISPQTLSSLLSTITPVQKRELFKIISKLRSEMKSGLGPFDLITLKNEFSSLDSKTAIPLNFLVDELISLNVFGKIDDPSIFDLVKPGQLVIIDLNNIISERKKQLIVSYLSQKLFNLRRVKKVCPFALLVEEAHNFIPENTSAEFALAKPILRTIAREGRKFGASLIIVSQRPKRLDTTTLANCNTNIILRITNPYDLDHIKQSSEGLDSGTISMISALRVGEAIIVGEAISAPTFFKVRMRESMPSKHEMSMEDAAKRFVADDKTSVDEISNFL